MTGYSKSFTAILDERLSLSAALTNVIISPKTPTRGLVTPLALLEAQRLVASMITSPLDGKFDSPPPATARALPERVLRCRHSAQVGMRLPGDEAQRKMFIGV